MLYQAGSDAQLSEPFLKKWLLGNNGAYQTFYKTAHLQIHVTFTANEGRYLEKQNIPKCFQLVQISYMNF